MPTSWIRWAWFALADTGSGGHGLPWLILIFTELHSWDWAYTAAVFTEKNVCESRKYFESYFPPTSYEDRHSQCVTVSESGSGLLRIVTAVESGVFSGTVAHLVC